MILVAQSAGETAWGARNEGEARLVHRDRNGGSDSRMWWRTIRDGQTGINCLGIQGGGRGKDERKKR